MPKRKKVGLVLSGGAALGFAHIGVIKTLLENDIPIDIITGTSMGALVGGAYAAGISIEEMEKIIETFSRRLIVDINPFVLTDTGLLFGNKVTNFLRKLLGDKKIEDCSKKYCAVAADLISGQKYVFTEGDLVTAIRSSISIPAVFKPVKLDKKVLVDGGACDNLPVDEARQMGADVIIAVDVFSDYKKPTQIKNTLDVILNSVNLLVASSVENKQDKGDIYIKIYQPDVRAEKFEPKDSKKSIEYGIKYAKEFMPEIKKALGIKDKKTKKSSKSMPIEKE